jgi:acylphosphatase
MSRTRARLVFRGRLNTASFQEFAQHRAQRLELVLKLTGLSGEAASLTLDGQDELIDAFEMACSLGPYDCLITEIERQDP